jgi:hypothetical protein
MPGKAHPFRDAPQSDSRSNTGRHGGQISPDRDVNFRYTTAAFTLSPEPGASVCRATLPFEVALYTVSVRRLIALRSGFLQAVPRGFALAFG